MEYDGGATIKALRANLPIIDIAKNISSICSGKMIKDTIFILVDGSSAMSLDEALMWFEVCPFSPLPTHRQFSPY